MEELQTIYLNYDFEIIADEEVDRVLKRYTGCCRFIHNWALDIINECRKEKKPLPFYTELSALVPQLKEKEETAFLKVCPAQALQQTLRRLSRSLSDALRPRGDPARKGWPRFKSRNDGDSMCLPQVREGEVDEANGRFKLRNFQRERAIKAGKRARDNWIRYRRSRSLDYVCPDGRRIAGTIKQMLIYNDAERWHVIFTVRFDVPVEQMRPEAVGVDMGVVHTLTTSEGVFYDIDMKSLKALEGRVAHVQAELDRNMERRKKLAKEGKAEPFDKFQPSLRRRRLRTHLRKLCKKQRCIRQDFQHKVGLELARKYGCVYVEDLNLLNLTASAAGTAENPGTNVRAKSGLNRSMLRAGLGGLRQSIEWALFKRGGVMQKVDPRWTSLTCPSCGYGDKGNRPEQALFHCLRCGYENNADIVGALNVMKRGQEGASPEAASEATLGDLPF